jgi:hypothetical protein
MDAIQDRYDPDLACSLDVVDREPARDEDNKIFLRGLLIGFGLAATAGVVFSICRSRRRYRTGPDYEDRYDRSRDSSGVIQGVADLVQGGACAFKDAMDAVDRTCQSVTQGIETVQDAFGRFSDD